MVKLTFKRDHSGSNMKGKERQRGRRKRGRKMSGADSWHNVPKHHFFFPQGASVFYQNKSTWQLRYFFYGQKHLLTSYCL